MNIFDTPKSVAPLIVNAEDAIARARAQLMQNQLAREATLRTFAEEAEARGDSAGAADFRRVLAGLVRDRENS
jgi:hypothetical protein